MIATRGYLAVPHHQSNTAFFPLLPLVLRAGRHLGVPFDVTGLVVANACLLVALIGLYELNRCWLDDTTALRSAIYAALFPTGYVFSMVYPEAIVLAAVAFAGLFAARSRWTAATAAAVVAGLGRPEAFFLVVPLGALAVRESRRAGGMAGFRALTAALAAPAAIAGVCLYEWRLFHDPMAYASAQKEWGRVTSVDGAHRALVELARSIGTTNEWLFRDAGFCALYVLLLVVALRNGLPRSWVLAGALIVLLPLWSGSFTSDARFGLLAVPVYSGLACLTRRRLVDIAARGLCVLGLVAATATILLRWP
jgi:Gpi18-like mannosyltransferase